MNELERRVLRLETRRARWRVFDASASREEVEQAQREGFNVMLMLWAHEDTPAYASDWQEVALLFGED